MVQFVDCANSQCNIFWIYPQSGTSPGSDSIPTGRITSSQYIVEVADQSGNIPEILEKIAYCESGNQHFNLDGSVKRGIQNPLDIGRFQINEKYWSTEASRLGWDISTLEGNTNMALYIYENYGTSPWNWSKECWLK